MSLHDWSNRTAPSLDDFDVIAQTVFETLPQKFRALCGDVPFVVQDFPDADVIAEMGLQTEFDILGLFQGPDLAMRDSGHPMPTMIFLYRRPILDYWAENDISLGAVIRHVLVHEIGHHFGLSDDDMARIEAE